MGNMKRCLKPWVMETKDERRQRLYVRSMAREARKSDLTLHRSLVPSTGHYIYTMRLGGRETKLSRYIPAGLASNCEGHR
jgi:hypothetical protein